MILVYSVYADGCFADLGGGTGLPGLAAHSKWLGVSHITRASLNVLPAAPDRIEKVFRGDVEMQQ